MLYNETRFFIAGVEFSFHEQITVTATTLTTTLIIPIKEDDLESLLASPMSRLKYEGVPVRLEISLPEKMHPEYPKDFITLFEGISTFQISYDRDSSRMAIAVNALTNTLHALSNIVFSELSIGSAFSTLDSAVTSVQDRALKEKTGEAKTVATASTPATRLNSIVFMEKLITGKGKTRKIKAPAEIYEFCMDNLLRAMTYSLPKGISIDNIFEGYNNSYASVGASISHEDLITSFRPGIGNYPDLIEGNRKMLLEATKESAPDLTLDTYADVWLYYKVFIQEIVTGFNFVSYNDMGEYPTDRTHKDPEKLAKAREEYNEKWKGVITGEPLVKALETDGLWFKGGIFGAFLAKATEASIEKVKGRPPETEKQDAWRYFNDKVPKFIKLIWGEIEAGSAGGAADTYGALMSDIKFIDGDYGESIRKIVDIQGEDREHGYSNIYVGSTGIFLAVGDDSLFHCPMHYSLLGMYNATFKFFFNVLASHIIVLRTTSQIIYFPDFLEDVFAHEDVKLKKLYGLTPGSIARLKKLVADILVSLLYTLDKQLEQIFLDILKNYQDNYKNTSTYVQNKNKRPGMSNDLYDKGYLKVQSSSVTSFRLDFLRKHAFFSEEEFSTYATTGIVEVTKSQFVSLPTVVSKYNSICQYLLSLLPVFLSGLKTSLKDIGELMHKSTHHSVSPKDSVSVGAFIDFDNYLNSVLDLMGNVKLGVDAKKFDSGKIQLFDVISAGRVYDTGTVNRMVTFGCLRDSSGSEISYPSMKLKDYESFRQLIGKYAERQTESVSLYSMLLELYRILQLDLVNVLNKFVAVQRNKIGSGELGNITSLKDNAYLTNKSVSELVLLPNVGLLPVPKCNVLYLDQYIARQNRYDNSVNYTKIIVKYKHEQGDLVEEMSKIPARSYVFDILKPQLGLKKLESYLGSVNYAYDENLNATYLNKYYYQFEKHHTVEIDSHVAMLWRLLTSAKAEAKEFVKATNTIETVLSDKNKELLDFMKRYQPEFAKFNYMKSIKFKHTPMSKVGGTYRKDKDTTIVFKESSVGSVFDTVLDTTVDKNKSEIKELFKKVLARLSSAVFMDIYSKLQTDAKGKKIKDINQIDKFKEYLKKEESLNTAEELIKNYHSEYPVHTLLNPIYFSFYKGALEFLGTPYLVFDATEGIRGKRQSRTEFIVAEQIYYNPDNPKSYPNAGAQYFKNFETDVLGFFDNAVSTAGFIDYLKYCAEQKLLNPDLEEYKKVVEYCSANTDFDLRETVNQPAELLIMEYLVANEGVKQLEFMSWCPESLSLVFSFAIPTSSQVQISNKDMFGRIKLYENALLNQVMLPILGVRIAAMLFKKISKVLSVVDKANTNVKTILRDAVINDPQFLRRAVIIDIDDYEQSSPHIKIKISLGQSFSDAITYRYKDLYSSLELDADSEEIEIEFQNIFKNFIFSPNWYEITQGSVRDPETIVNMVTRMGNFAGFMYFGAYVFDCYFSTLVQAYQQKLDKTPFYRSKPIEKHPILKNGYSKEHTHWYFDKLYLLPNELGQYPPLTTDFAGCNIYTEITNDKTNTKTFPVSEVHRVEKDNKSILFSSLREVDRSSQKDWNTFRRDAYGSDYALVAEWNLEVKGADTSLLNPRIGLLNVSSGGLILPISGGINNEDLAALGGLEFDRMEELPEPIKKFLKDNNPEKYLEGAPVEISSRNRFATIIPASIFDGKQLDTLINKNLLQGLISNLKILWEQKPLEFSKYDPRSIAANLVSELVYENMTSAIQSENITTARKQTTAIFSSEADATKRAIKRLVPTTEFEKRSPYGQARYVGGGEYRLHSGIDIVPVKKEGLDQPIYCVAPCDGEIQYCIQKDSLDGKSYLTGYALYFLFVPKVKESINVVPVLAVGHLSIKNTFQYIFSLSASIFKSDSLKEYVEAVNPNSKNTYVSDEAYSKAGTEYEKDRHVSISDILLHEEILNVKIPVTAGSYIGCLGNTGSSAGYHFHVTVIPIEKGKINQNCKTNLTWIRNLNRVASPRYSGLDMGPAVDILIDQTDSPDHVLGNPLFPDVYENERTEQEGREARRSRYQQIRAGFAIESSLPDQDLIHTVATYTAYNSIIELTAGINLPPVTLPYYDPYFVDGTFPMAVVYKDDIILTRLNTVQVSCDSRGLNYTTLMFSTGISARKLAYFMLNTYHSLPVSWKKILQDSTVFPLHIVDYYNEKLFTQNNIAAEYQTFFGKNDFVFDWRKCVYLQDRSLYDLITTEVPDIYAKYLRDTPVTYNDITIKLDSVMPEWKVQGDESLMLESRAWAPASLFTAEESKKKSYRPKENSTAIMPLTDKNKKDYETEASKAFSRTITNNVSDIPQLFYDWKQFFEILKKLIS